MTELKNPYPSVCRYSAITYGGNQQWSEDGGIRKCGCGLVAAADTFIYLTKNRENCRSGPAASLMHYDAIPEKIYDEFLKMLRKNYLPLLPPFGISFIELTAGIELYFKRWHLPFSASWGTGGKEIWSAAEEMLENDIPVIMSIGQNFPFIWQNNRLNFYRKENDVYLRTSSAKAHYIVITGSDEKWLRISSWGREYYINKIEFADYVHKHSLKLISSVLSIREK